MPTERDGKGRFIKGHRKSNFFSAEMLLKLRKRMRGNQWNKGRIPWNKGKTNVYSIESLRKFSDSHKGLKGFWRGKKRPEISKENHYNWKGGINCKNYPLAFNNELKELIRKRDNYKCQICNCFQKECLRKLDIHHKDGDKTNLNPNNLISLCRSCHMKLEKALLKLPVGLLRERYRKNNRFYSKVFNS